MKRWIIVLAFILSLALCACIKNQSNDEDNGTNAGTTGTTDNTGTSDEREDTAYKDIERYQATGYEKSYFGFSDDLTMLCIEHPAEWSFRQTTEGFDIIRDDIIVGNIVNGAASDAESWTLLTSTNRLKSGINVKRYIERSNTEGEAQYRYRYVYDYSVEGNKHIMTLITTCAELDKTSEENLMDAFRQKISVGETMGILSQYQDSWSSILILGNSFVRTSNVGGILKEMLRNNGKKCSVTSIPLDGASVATFVNNNIVMDEIGFGHFDAVFISGFYEPREVTNLGILKNACDQSGTELIIIPAHNEIEATLSSVQTAYPTIPFLNWKGEIECILATGVDRWELCFNDYQNHSKPLAGYVGAHMIYRAIYNELPKVTVQSSITQSYIDSILGDYAYTGKVEVVDEDNIIYLD